MVPELDNVIANLELMPLRMNESKNDKVGDRQRDMAKKFYQAGAVEQKGAGGRAPLSVDMRRPSGQANRQRRHREAEAPVPGAAQVGNAAPV